MDCLVLRFLIISVLIDSAITMDSPYSSFNVLILSLQWVDFVSFTLFLSVISLIFSSKIIAFFYATTPDT